METAGVDGRDLGDERHGFGDHCLYFAAVDRVNYQAGFICKIRP